MLKWAFYGDKAYFRSLTASYGLSLDLEDLYKLNDYLTNRVRGEQLLKEVGEKLEVSILTEQFERSQANYKAFMISYGTAQEVFQQLGKNFDFLRKSVNEARSFQELTKKIEALVALCEQTDQKYQVWQKYLTKEQINRLFVSSTFQNELKQTLHRDFDLLTEADVLKSNFSPIEAEVCQALETQPATQNEDFIRLFQNSLRLAWLVHLEELYPVLRAVSSLKMGQLEQELQEGILQKQSLSREILLMQLREQTGKNVEFNRLQNRVTYRELHHQVTKNERFGPYANSWNNMPKRYFGWFPVGWLLRRRCLRCFH